MTISIGLNTTVNDIPGSSHDDNLRGTHFDDVFHMEEGGIDICRGRGGNDTFLFGAEMTSQDTIYGGSFSDALFLEGDYSGTKALVFATGTMHGVETLHCIGEHSYDITFSDAQVRAGERFLVDGPEIGKSQTLSFDGSAETDGTFNLNGGFEHDRFTGSQGSDDIRGGFGSDRLDGGGGADTFVLGFGELLGRHADTITGFDVDDDRFLIFTNVPSSFQTLNTGTLDAGNFVANLKAAIDAQLDPNEALVFRPDAGTLAGHTFLIIDVDATAGYNTQEDHVIRMDGAHGLNHLDADNFFSI